MQNTKRIIEWLNENPNKSAKEITSALELKSSSALMTLNKLTKENRVVREKAAQENHVRGPKNQYLYRAA